MGVGQGLIGLGILTMLAANLIGFVPIIFYIGFYSGVAVAGAGVAWLIATSRGSSEAN